MDGHATAGPVVNAPRALLHRGDSFKPEAIDWVWAGYLARGKMTVLGGKPGTGKTTLALAIAATMTRGARWPDGTQALAADVVLWSGEDDASDTLIPRLMAMGADLTRVHVVGPVISTEKGAVKADNQPRVLVEKTVITPFDPALHIDALAAAMDRLTDAGLIIVDPLVSAVAGDSHKNAETRRGLQPLVNLAAGQKCALLGVTHFSKGTAGKDPLDRITGSLAFGAMARVVLVAAQETEGENAGRRLMMRCKSNIGPDTGGFEYDIGQHPLPGFADISASSVQWGAAVDGTARELLADAEQPQDDNSDDTAAFLRSLLADGPMLAKDVYRDGDGAGYSKDQLKRALRKIKGTSKKDGMRGGWSWHLPEESTNKHRAPFTPFSTLRAPFVGKGAPLEGSEGSEEREGSRVNGVRSSPSAAELAEIEQMFAGRA